MAFVVVDGGVARIAVVAVAGAEERVVVEEPEPQPARSLGGGTFDWLPDTSGVVYAGRAGGIWRQPISGGPVVRVADGMDLAAPAVSPDGDRVAYVVDTRHVEVVDADGTVTRISGGADFAVDPTWSPDGTLVAWHEWDVPAMPWDASRIVLAPADGSAPGRTVAGGPGTQVQQPRFSPDGRRLAYLCDATGWLVLTVMDLDSGSTVVLDEQHEHGGPTWGHGQRSFAWSPAGDRLAVCRNESGFGALHVWVPGEAPRPMARAVHGGLSWAGGRLAAIRTGARTPTQVVVYEGDRGDERGTVAQGPIGFEGSHLPEPDLVSWPSTDGTEIPGRLYRPRPGGGPPPLLVWVHGGPTDQWQVEFRPRFTYWLERGWAILVPDHRGSTGHGRAFAQALAGRWGEVDVEDVASGVRAAGERGWGDARRCVVMGASAGGFTALNVLAGHPGLCAAGVDLYGVADLLALAEVDHRFEAHYTHSLVGPLPAAAETFRRRSPLHRAPAIVDPLLILQGDADHVVPAAQSEALAARLAELGRDVELHVYEGEGHGWGRASTIIDELARTESFLDRHVLRRQP